MESKKLKYLFIIIILFALVGNLSAQMDDAVINTKNLSLADAVTLGLENNFDIRIAKQNLKIAQNNNAWGLAGGFPSINLGVNQNNSFNDAPNRFNPDVRDKYNSNVVAPYVNMRWTLFNGFAVHINKKRLALLNKLSEGNAALVVENTVQGIVLAYFKSLLEGEKLQVLEKVLHLSKDRYHYVLSKKELGNSEKSV